MCVCDNNKPHYQNKCSLFENRLTTIYSDWYHFHLDFQDKKKFIYVFSLLHNVVVMIASVYKTLQSYCLQLFCA